MLAPYMYDQYGVSFYTYQGTHHTNNVQQFGAKGDVQIRRSPDGFLVVPEHLLFGSKTFAEKTQEFIGERKPS